MNIVLAKETDLNSIYELTSCCIKRMKEEGIDQWDTFYPNIFTFEKDIKSQSLFIYKDADTLIGCFVMNENQEPEYKDVNWEYKADKICVVHRLMVNPEYQGKGVAKELMHFAEKLAKIRNYRAIRLDAFLDNSRAVNFYRTWATRRLVMSILERKIRLF